MKRPLTLTAGILGTVANVGLVILYALAAYVLIFGGVIAGGQAPEAGAAIGLVTIIVAIAAIFSIVALILNACTINCFSASAEKFSKKKALIITAIVFNALTAICGFIYTTIWTIILALVVVATIVLQIVDLCLENKRIREQNKPAAEATPVENTENPEQK